MCIKIMMSILKALQDLSAIPSRFTADNAPVIPNDNQIIFSIAGKEYSVKLELIDEDEEDL
ncbi:MAG: hypothetical protein II306_02965 [Clostridia bacterium]|nr:hypothetical protein [Clostridia bacterium]